MKKKKPEPNKRIPSLLLVLAIMCMMFVSAPIVSEAADYTSWEQLQNAINRGAASTYTLTQDLVAPDSVADALNFPSGTEAVLDLNGYTLDRNCSAAEESGQVISVSAGATLTIKDSSGTNTGWITGGRAQNNGAGIYVSGTLYFEGGTITGNISGSNGAGIYIKGGSGFISGGTIKDNTASEYGGGIFSRDGGTITMTGGSIENNTAGKDGGGIHLNNSKASIRDVTIDDNRTKTSGGGIFITSRSECRLENVTVTNNKADYDGGGIKANSGSKVTIALSSVSSNTASGNGGGIFTHENANITLSSTTIASNKAKRGGGIFVNGAAVSVEAGRLSSNNADQGGAVCAYKNSTLTVTDAEISHNNAGDKGAAFYVQEGSCTVTDSNILYNVGGDPDDGTYYTQNGKLELTNCTLADPNYSTSWNDLKSAISAVKYVTEESCFTLDRDISAADTDAMIEIVSGQTIRLDLAGHTLSRNRSSAVSDGCVFVVRSGGTLTVMDSSGDNSGKITGGNSVNNGGAVCVFGTLNFEGGTITGNKCNASGGGIYCDGGTINISGGVIENNTAGKSGGGISGENGKISTITITGGTIRKNKAENGGGIYADIVKLNITDGSIQNNTAANGGGAYLSNSSVVVKSAAFTGNQATDRGGGVYITNSSSCSLTDTVIDGNTAKNADGGGIYIRNEGKLTIKETDIKGNTATTCEGGGIMINNSGLKLALIGADIRNNTAQLAGAGVLARGTIISMKGYVVIDNNTAMLTSPEDYNYEGWTDSYTKTLPEGFAFGYQKICYIPFGLYVTGFTEDKNPLLLSDVIVTGTRHDGTHENGNIAFDVSDEKTLAGESAEGSFHSIYEIKKPNSVHAFDIATPIRYNKKDKPTEASPTFIYIRGNNAEGKYISSICVGAYSRAMYKKDLLAQKQNVSDNQIIGLISFRQNGNEND